MSRRAWFYIAIILLLGAVLSLVSIGSGVFNGDQVITFAVFIVLATAAQLYMVRVPGHQSYHANVLVFFSGLLLLQPSFFVLLVIIPHLIEWAKERLWKSPRLRDWYLQPFNMATHIIAGSAARWLYVQLDPSGSVFLTPVSVLSVMTAALTYVAVNHVVIGQALVLARQVSWKESGVLETENLLIDFVLLLLGYVVAILWRVHPWLIVPALSPVILIYRALMVPQLMKEAQTDEKTGLWSTRHFMRLFNTEIERARRFQRPLSLLMADLDLLRDINNTSGHLAGDALLASVAQLMRSNLRSYDIAGRFGGDEFCIVLPEVGLTEAREVAQRIRQAIANARFEAKPNRESIHATMSFGVACFPTDATTAMELIHQADLAVYQAKLKGRNRVECAADVPHSVKLENPIPKSILAMTDITMPAFRQAGRSGQETGPASARAQVASGTQTVSASAERKVYPPWLLWLFIALVCVGGAIATAGGVLASSGRDATTILLLAVLGAIAQMPQTKNLYGDSSVSVSVAAIFAAGLISGVEGVAVVSAAVVVAHRLQIHPFLVTGTIYKTAFNWGSHVLAGLAPVVAVKVVGIPFGLNNLLLFLLPAILAALAYYIIETGLIATAISLSEARDLLHTWRERYSWLVVHYLALCILGLFLSAAYTALGAIGLTVFAIPVLMVAYAQKQYLDRTQKSVQELQRMNQELTLANQEISNASQAIGKLNEELFLTLAKIIDARDPYVSNHAAKVAEYATAIAAELNLPPDRIERVRQGAFLHDIGKIGIPEAILHKPDKLTKDEYECVKTHVNLGADFLQTCRGLQHLVPLVRYHHEWWNGQGYPNGLRGERPPLEARILALADAVEAMASDRPYHRAMRLEEIIAEVTRCSAVQFDPAVVDAFVRVARRQGTKLVVNSARNVSQTRVREMADASRAA